jgi:hypothetical protein
LIRPCIKTYSFAFPKPLFEGAYFTERRRIIADTTV